MFTISEIEPNRLKTEITTKLIFISQWIDRYVRITLSELFDQQSKIGNVFK
jgi:hypothetical protein